MNTDGRLENRRSKIDLHLHTRLSDGDNTVSEVIELAYNEGMRVIALSDHNKFAIKEKMKIERENGLMEVIPACEFSSTYYVPSRKRTAEIHVIGLFENGVNPDNFADIFAPIREGKINYVKAIIDKLNTLGIDISIDEVKAVKKDSSYMGRHRIADVLIKKGYADNVDDAFDNYIGNFSKYYVPSTEYVKYADMDMVIKGIIENGGLPILCHPFGYSLEKDEIETLVKRFADIAGDKGGMEVYYENYLDDSNKIAFLKELSEKYGLFVSASSDRHRPFQPFASVGDYSMYLKALERLK